MVSSLLFIPNVVYAQSEDLFPATPRPLEFYDYYFVQAHGDTYEYSVVYYLPYIYDREVASKDYFLVVKHTWAFYRDTINYSTSSGSYKLVDVVILEDRTEFYFTFTMHNSRVNFYSGDLTLFFKEDSKMYLGIDEQYLYPAEPFTKSHLLLLLLVIYIIILYLSFKVDKRVMFLSSIIWLIPLKWFDDILLIIVFIIMFLLHIIIPLGKIRGDSDDF